MGVREEPIGSGHLASGITPRTLGTACSRGVSLRTGGGGGTGGNRRDRANAGRNTVTASKSKTTAVCVEAVAVVVERPESMNIALMARASFSLGGSPTMAVAHVGSPDL